METQSDMPRPKLLIATAAAAGIIVGFGLGRLTVSEPRLPPIPSGQPTRLPSLAGSNHAGSGIDGEQPSLLGDPEAAQRVRNMAEAAMSWGASPQRVVGTIIDQMDEDELVSLVTSLTDYSRSELENVEDMRAFAERLAEVAMDGTVVPAEELGADVENVSFATDVLENNAPASPGRHFVQDQERIYATFPSDELDGARVVAKWTRVEDGEIMLFRRYVINPGEDWSYVWVGAPDSGWRPGEYRVDFYSADEAMTLVASGQHIITP
jgi:hypothetical protein